MRRRMILLLVYYYYFIITLTIIVLSFFREYMICECHLITKIQHTYFFSQTYDIN